MFGAAAGLVSGGGGDHTGAMVSIDLLLRDR